jgi:signal transduction histidine kinase
MNQILILDAQTSSLDTVVDYLQIFTGEYTIERKNALTLAPSSIEFSPDLCLLILDGELPNYLEYLSALKNHSQTISIPVLLCLPSDAMPESATEAISKGVTDFMIAPWQVTLVEARVKSNLTLIQSQKAIYRQKQDLKELTETQNYLMSIVAHDLKAPLNRVQGLVQLLPLVGPLNEEQKEQVEMMDKAVESGRKLIEDILTINAYEADYDELYLEEVNLDEFVAEIVGVYQQSIADKKHIEILLDLKASLSIKTDRESLMRILDNLISNAVKFSPSHKKVFIILEKKEENIVISIKDQGPGISKEDQKKMFKKFQKLSAKPTGGESSTGLGLSIIKVLTQKLKGSIDYETKLNEGTTFRLILPSLS